MPAIRYVWILRFNVRAGLQNVSITFWEFGNISPDDPHAGWMKSWEVYISSMRSSQRAHRLLYYQLVIFFIVTGLLWQIEQRSRAETSNREHVICAHTQGRKKASNISTMFLLSSVLPGRYAIQSYRGCFGDIHCIRHIWEWAHSWNGIRRFGAFPYDWPSVPCDAQSYPSLCWCQGEYVNC